MRYPGPLVDGDGAGILTPRRRRIALSIFLVFGTQTFPTASAVQLCVMFRSADASSSVSNKVNDGIASGASSTAGLFAAWPKKLATMQPFDPPNNGGGCDEQLWAMCIV
jgi:hypothetical protein